MTTALQQTVAEAIACHEKLKQLAEAEDWQAFVEYAPVCEQVVRQINTQETNQADEPLREQLQRLLALNNEIREISEKQRDTLAAMLRELNQGRKAHKAYNQ